ncbi:hypothetical protein INT82_05190 [Mannheimia haemolytica]|nr:hypothetical protein [Mannheimia haemolytica]
MFYSNNPLIKHKTGLLNLAEELGNISQACKSNGNEPRYILSLSTSG